MSIRKCKALLAAAPVAIEFALDRMQAKAEERGSAVVVQDTVTERFVQYLGGFGRPIMIDVPATEKNIRSMERLRELLGDKPSYYLEGPTRIPVYQRECSTPAEAAALGVRVLRECQELPDKAVLAIEEIDAGKVERLRWSTS